MTQQQEEEEDLIVGLKAGDILLFSRPCSHMDIISAGICFGAKFLGWTEWDHLGLVVEDPETHNLYLLEANVGGITLHPLIERIKRTKSSKLSVRKLTIQVNHAAPEEVILQEFRSKLWNISQSYLKKVYNKSFLNMADALINSYTHNFFTKLLKLKHDRVILKENEYMIRSLQSQCNRNSFLDRLLSAYLSSMKLKIENLQKEIELLEKSFPGKSPEVSGESENGQKSEAYYCSQLVAEIFMEMDILSKHRLSYQYIPADFSSSTVMKGLVTHACDSLVTDDEPETIDILNPSKSHKYLYSPDILIPDKSLLKFSVNQPKNKVPTASTFFTELVLEYPIFSSIKGASSKANSTPKYEIPFHTSDVLSLSTLKSLFENHREGKNYQFSVDGELRIYRFPRRVHAESINSYEFVGVLNSSVSKSLDVAEYLKLLYFRFHQDYYLYVSAVKNSTLTIQSIPSEERKKIEETTRNYRHLQDRELFKTIYEEIFAQVGGKNSFSRAETINVMDEGFVKAFGNGIEKYSSINLKEYIDKFSSEFSDLLDHSAKENQFIDFFILFCFYMKAIEGEPEGLLQEIRYHYPKFYHQHTPSLPKKVAQISVTEATKTQDQEYKSLSIPLTAVSALSMRQFRQRGRVSLSLVNDHVAKILFILDKYQEQSQLLGPHVVDLVNPISDGLLRYLNLEDNNALKFHALCRVVQILCKVRGQKNVAKYLPHEVHHFEPCLKLLHSQDKSDHNTWQSRYVLLLWMGTLCLTPFDIYSIDSSSLTIPDYIIALKPKSFTLISIVIETAKSYLADFGPTRDAGCVCLSSMLTRPDADKIYLDTFLDYCIHEFQNRDDTEKAVFSQEKNCLFLGILSALNQIFKKGHREKLILLIPKIRVLLQSSLAFIDRGPQQTLERKYLCKLIQRIGMVFLAPVEATWRYQKNYRSLNLLSNKTVSNVVETEELKTSGVDDESLTIPEEIEEILDRVLTFLSDKDTIVRWSAAKGIGRITMRLTKALGMDIVSAVIQLFEDKTSENVWHGGCLALGELSRRGLLLPETLSDAIPLILDALNFDLAKGQHYVGSNIRDAACYVCWAFARAYSPQVLKPFMKDLSLGLLATALFDREINCRRAASAAFQENVGRQGNENFTFGIEIITIADFFAVSNRNHSFLNLSVEIAALDVGTYFLPFITHLKDYKINHWDNEIRELSAKAMAKLCYLLYSSPMIDLGLSYSDFTNNILAELLDSAVSENLHERHGALLSLSTILSVLTFHRFNCDLKGDNIPIFQLSAENQTKIENLVPLIEKKRLYRGKGGELIREAVCFFIETLSKLRLQFSNNKSLILLLESLNDHLKQPQQNIQLQAKSALRLFLFYYFSERRVIPINPFPNDKVLAMTVKKYMEVLSNSNESNVAVIRGSILALGVLPDRFVLLPNQSLAVNEEGKTESNLRSQEPNIIAILELLDEYSSSSKLINGEYDAEACQYAIEAAVELCERMISSYLYSEAYLIKTMQILFKGANDYSIDKRGDTGSWARIASMRGIERIMSTIFGNISRHYNYLASVEPNCILTGKLLQTPYGAAVIRRVLPSLTSEVLKPFRAGQLLEVEFFGQTLGFEESCKERWITTKLGKFPITSLFNYDITISEKYSEYDDILKNLQCFSAVFMTNSTDNSFSSQIISILLQQLSEKLDLVRSIAGSILERILLFKFNLSSVTSDLADKSIKLLFPEEYQLVEYMKEVNELLKTSDTSIAAVDNAIEQDIQNTRENEDKNAENCDDDNADAENQDEDEKLDWVEEGTSSHSDEQQYKSNLVINWNRPDHVYPLTVRYLLIKEYFYPVFSGLIISMGGLTETIVKSSRNSFLLQCQSLFAKQTAEGNSNKFDTSSDFLVTLMSSIEQIFVSFAKNDRVILPLLKSLQLLLKENVFHKLAVSPTGRKSESMQLVSSFYNNLILNLLFGELKATNQIPKFFLIIDLYILLLTMVENSPSSYQINRRKILFYLLQLLSHRFPRVRKYVAEALYLFFISDASCFENDGNLSGMGDLDFKVTADGYQEVLDLLVQTQWDMDTNREIHNKQVIADRRNQLLTLFRFEIQVSQEKASTSTRRNVNKEKKDELDSYDALVREAGY